MKKLAVLWQDLPAVDRRKYEDAAQADKKRFAHSTSPSVGQTFFKYKNTILCTFSFIIPAFLLLLF